MSIVLVTLRAGACGKGLLELLELVAAVAEADAHAGSCGTMRREGAFGGLRTSGVYFHPV